MSLQEQARLACIQGWFEPSALTPLQAGRINDSYRVQTSGSDQAFVLQAVNGRVFRSAIGLVAQLERVVAHLNQRSPGRVPDLVATQTGAMHLQSDDRVWRLWRFVAGENLQSDNCPQDLLVARLRAAGAAFANTQVLLEDLPGARLTPGIAHHHDLEYVLAQFDAQATQATSQWCERVERYRGQPTALQQRDGYIHGDCKPDNLLFAVASAEVTAVLDLDTVMWGNRALDFGDLVRSSVWQRATSQQEAFTLPLFEALLDGFASGHRASTRPIAAEQLLQAPEFISFMLSLRYLNDHLRGDVEFKVQQRGDNLQRAERQFQRTVALTGAREQMHQAIARRY